MTMPYTTFHIFNSTKTVSISTKLIKEYEKYHPSIKIYTVEYLILIEGGNKNDSEEKLSELLKKGIEYEIYFKTHDADEVSKAIKEGMIE